MKKILKSILIATAAIGTISGSTAAVVSCSRHDTIPPSRKSTMDEQASDLILRWKQATGTISTTLAHNATMGELVSLVVASVSEYKNFHSADYDLLGDTITAEVNGQTVQSKEKYISSGSGVTTFKSKISVTNKDGTVTRNLDNIDISFNIYVEASQEVQKLQNEIDKWSATVQAQNLQAKTYKDQPGTWGEIVLTFYNSLLKALNDLVNDNATEYDYLGINSFTISGHSTTDATAFDQKLAPNGIFSTTGDTIRYSIDAKFDDKNVRQNNIISNQTFNKTTVFSAHLFQIVTEPTNTVEINDFLETWFNTFTSNNGSIAVFLLTNTWANVQTQIQNSISNFFTTNAVFYSRIKGITSVVIANLPTTPIVEGAVKFDFSNITINYTYDNGGGSGTQAGTANFSTTHITATGLNATIFMATVFTQLDYFATQFSIWSQANPISIDFNHTIDHTSSYGNLSSLIKTQAETYLTRAGSVLANLTLLKNESVTSLNLTFDIFDGTKLAHTADQFNNLGQIELHYRIGATKADNSVATLDDKSEPIIINNVTKKSELEKAQVDALVQTLTKDKITIDNVLPQPRVDALESVITSNIWKEVQKHPTKYANLDFSSETNIKVHLFKSTTDATDPTKELKPQQLIDVDTSATGKTVNLANYAIVIDFLTYDYSAGIQHVESTSALALSTLSTVTAITIDPDQYNVLKVYEESQSGTHAITPGKLIAFDPSVSTVYGRDINNQLTAAYLENFLSSPSTVDGFNANSLNMFQQHFTGQITGSVDAIVAALNNTTTQKDDFYLSLPVKNEQTIVFQPTATDKFILPTAVKYSASSQSSFFNIKRLNDYFNPFAGSSHAQRPPIQLSTITDKTNFKTFAAGLITAFNAATSVTGAGELTGVSVESIGNLTAAKTWAPVSPGPTTIVLSITDSGTKYMYAISTYFIS